ncbi:hypothetical protein JCM33774_75470 [Actinophytocola sp. KF-1]
MSSATTGPASRPADGTPSRVSTVVAIRSYASKQAAAASRSDGSRPAWMYSSSGAICSCPNLVSTATRSTSAAASASDVPACASASAASRAASSATNSNMASRNNSRCDSKW